ncbi:hypothetical protein FACS1894192_10140 [Bacilli bacterium]|nr:hypothetical protein FACS1894192_10140 [Bacilli bacterium]
MVIRRGIDASEVGKRIRKLRKNKKLTLEKLGSLLSEPAPKGNVYNWEKGMSLPGRNRLSDIAQITGTTVDYLLTGVIKADDVISNGNDTDSKTIQIPARIIKIDFVQMEILYEADTPDFGEGFVISSEFDEPVAFYEELLSLKSHDDGKVFDDKQIDYIEGSIDF